MAPIQKLLRPGAVTFISLLLTVHPVSFGGAFSTARPSLANTADSSDATERYAGTQAARVREIYGKLPLSFQSNSGQTDGRVRFLAQGAGYALFLTDSEAVLRLREGQSRREAATTRVMRSKGQSDTNGRSHDLDLASQPLRGLDEAAKSIAPPNVLRIRLMGANKRSEASGEDEQEGKSNYFVGNDPTKWRTNVGHYSRVRYANVYAGIDQLYYGNHGQLEYDFIVAPGADYEQISLQFEGAKPVRIDAATGELVLKFRDGSEVRQLQPYAYQEVDGQKRGVAARYVRKQKGQIGFALEGYDPLRPLVIDPVLIYSTYLGGSGSDTGNGIAVDSFGNAYVTGETESLNFPTANAIQSGYGGSFDVFVTKINTAGSARVYSTFLGGGAGDEGNGIAVDSFGNAYITGSTTSNNFPTAFAIQPTLSGNRDAFVTKLNAAGSAFFYSTYLGGSSNDISNAIAVDSAGTAYITGSTNSNNFPIAGAIQQANGGVLDAFVTRINAAGSARLYSTYLGGVGEDIGFGIAVDSSNNAYFTGSTASFNFPTLSPIQGMLRGGTDAFVTKLNSSGLALYSTYLGGGGTDVGRGVAVDSSGNAHVAGYTLSTNFPTAAALQPTLRGATDAFVTKFNTAGSVLVYSTYLGGVDGNDLGYGIQVDAFGNTYVTGYTTSTNFPTVSPIQPAKGDFFNADAFVTKFNVAGSALVYSTYLGGANIDEGHGLAVDSLGNAYVTGITFSSNFPTASPIQPVNGGGNNVVSSDAFVTKIRDDSVPPLTVQLSASNYAVGEGGGRAQIVVIRANSLAAATVDYVTNDNAGLNECNLFNGVASSRCDYAISIGTLRFAAGEASKTIFIPIVDDSYAEGNEAFNITLSNPTGTTLSSPTTATITIQDNETTNGANPIDGVDFFIRQQYIDILGREPEPAGLAGWRNVLNNCGTTVAPPCDRIEVAAGFFRSEEFQSRGYFIYRFYSTVGRIPLYSEFIRDFAKVSGFLTADQLQANKVAFVDEFMARAEFQTKYSATFNNPTAYVDALLLTVGLPAHPSRASWIAGLTNGSLTRAQVLRQLVESTEVYNKYYNEAFVIMQYFGYLRRTADASYLDWLQTMNQTGGDYRTMINGFINSAEYRRRFGP
ncbi:MAG: SBBP repeat-containing protein [Acidobacteriota bacterium]